MEAIIFDTETTGFEQGQIIEAAWVEVGLKKETPYLYLISEFEQRYKPSQKISLGALATHHILEEELVNCPDHTTFALPEVEYLIGHNVDFDWMMAGKPDVKLICTLSLARKTWPNLDSYSQSALLYYIKSPSYAREMLKKSHSARTDVSICAAILIAILQSIGGVDSWEQLWEISEDARIPTIMPFGKHKGNPIAEVPRDYKDWYLSQDEIDPYIVKAFSQ